MRLALLVVGPVLFALVNAVNGFARNPLNVEKVIADLESRWAAAQKDGKTESVAPMLADRFITIGTDGKLTNKNELLAHMKPGNWDDYGISDVKVIVYGDVAIATGLWAGKGQVGDHKVDIHERWTDTWVPMPAVLGNASRASRRRSNRRALSSTYDF